MQLKGHKAPPKPGTLLFFSNEFLFTTDTDEIIQVKTSLVLALSSDTIEWSCQALEFSLFFFPFLFFFFLLFFLFFSFFFPTVPLQKCRLSPEGFGEGCGPDLQNLLDHEADSLHTDGLLQHPTITDKPLKLRYSFFFFLFFL